MLSCFSCVQLFVTLWTIPHQAPLSLGILQATILEWVATPLSRESSPPRDPTCVPYVSCVGRQILYHKHHLGSLRWMNEKLITWESEVWIARDAISLNCSRMRSGVFKSSFPSLWSFIRKIWQNLFSATIWEKNCKWVIIQEKHFPSKPEQHSYPHILAPSQKNRKVNIAPSEERSQLARLWFRRRIEVNCLESTCLKRLMLYHYFLATYYSFHTLKYSTSLLISNSLSLNFTQFRLSS